MRCQGMKGAIALLLVTALFLVIGMSTKSLAAIEPKVKFENDGFLIEDADIPDLSKAIGKNNIEKNFVDILTNLYNVIDEYCKSETDNDFYEVANKKSDIATYSVFIDDRLDDEFRRILEDSADVKIGYSKIGNKNCIAYVLTNTMTEKSYCIYIEQQEKTIFIKTLFEPKVQSRTIIRRLIDARDEDIAYYDFDIILAMQYREKQLGL